MKVELRNMGYILRDANIFSAVRRQQPVVQYSPHCAASKCFADLCELVLDPAGGTRKGNGLVRFLSRLARPFAGGKGGETT